MSDTNPLVAIQQIKALAQEIEDALRRQDEVLRMRGLSLSPALFEALTAVLDDVNNIEARLVEEATTLGQFRTLAGTSGQINSALELVEVLAEAKVGRAS